jgi:TetR/AcrR family transcriptional regulator
LSGVRLSGPERREQLLQVAIDLFSRKGFNGTTTREIAAAAGVTEAIIFRHFETKEDLYTAIIDYKLTKPGAERVAELNKAMGRNDDEAVIRQLIGAVIWIHKSDPKFEKLMLYAALEGNQTALRHISEVTSTVVGNFRRYVLRRQKLGAIRPINPDLVFAAIMGVAKQFALYKYIHEFQQQHVSDDEAIEAFTTLALDGLCVNRRAKAPARIKKR